MSLLRHSLKLLSLSLIVSAVVLDVWGEDEFRHFEEIKAVMMG